MQRQRTICRIVLAGSLAQRPVELELDYEADKVPAIKEEKPTRILGIFFRDEIILELE